MYFSFHDRLMKFLVIVLFATIVQSQFFDPVLDDKTYLDRIEEQIQSEVEKTAIELMESTKTAEKVTNSYISIKLKDNVFKTLRSLAETEVIAFQNNLNKPLRVGRQEAAEASNSGSGSSGSGDNESADSEQSESGNDEEATEKPTTPLNGLSTAVKINQNVFQFIGEAIKTIFKGVGGKRNFVRGESNAAQDSSASNLVQELPNLMKKPYADQLIGILTLLNKDNEEKKSPGTVNIKKGLFPQPLETLFGNRGQGLSNFARKSDIDEEDVTVYIEKLKQNHPLLFPDLYRGIPEARRLLDSMAQVVAGINREQNYV